MHEKLNRQLICHICAKVYHSVSSLRIHILDHSDIKQPRMICQMCGISCKNERSLSKHMHLHRRDGQTFTCPQCPKISPNKNALARHIRSVHNYVAQVCHLCGKEFKRTVALTVSICIVLVCVS